MGLKIYKPNPSKKGHACHFQLTAAGDGKGIYLDMIKQTGWDNGSKKGSFKGGDQIKIKFNGTEAAGMVDSIETEREVKLFHKSEKTGSTQITFAQYVNKKTNKHMGHSLAVNRGGKTFLMGFTHAERRELKEWLLMAIQKLHLAEYAADKKQRQDNYEQNKSQ